MYEGDFPLIEAWGRMLGSPNDYIERQKEMARRDDAPWNAIYKYHDALHPRDRKWATAADVTSKVAREQLDDVLVRELAFDPDSVREAYGDR